ncbi:hypothetical protein [Conexibacter sp. DBS9H8]|uniref:hypothetical protein n=1 Tax=Conexibacter sp. DBS9H8 TaxID=2937801 RepID=UPI00200E47EF|nr:hypothetical protein [Conexibacter sp. DBS9H8]
MRSPGLIPGGALLTTLCAIAAAGAVLLDRALTHAPRRPAAVAAPLPARPPAGTAAQQLTLSQVERAFAASYALYLDGAAIGVLHDASLTARAQARSGGRIPAAFRDGTLRVAAVSGSSSPFSARAQLVLANREERYPLVVQLLHEQHGWQVAQLQPPDLTIDETVKPVAGVNMPSAAQEATRRFAIAYAAYRAGVAPLPAGMTAAAVAAIRSREDTLAGVRLPAMRPRLVSVSYGPLNEDEFAATATVRFGATAERFSLLMQLRKQTGGWLCAAFL